MNRASIFVLIALAVLGAVAAAVFLENDATLQIAEPSNDARPSTSSASVGEGEAVARVAPLARGTLPPPTPEPESDLVPDPDAQPAPADEPAADAPPRPRRLIGVFTASDDLGRRLGVLGKGAYVTVVVAGAPAARAGLLPGDLIRAVDGSPVRERLELTRRLAGTKLGVAVTLDVLRGTEARGAEIMPLPIVPGPDEASYRAGIRHLESLMDRYSGPELFGEIAEMRWRVGDRDAALALVTEWIPKHPESSALKLRRLAWLAESGENALYCGDALRYAAAHSEDVGVLRHAVRASLAVGSAAEAESLALHSLAKGVADERVDGQGAFSLLTMYWMYARMRQSKSLDDDRLDAALGKRQVHGFVRSSLAFWRAQLSGARTYQLDAASGARRLELDEGGGFPVALNARMPARAGLGGLSEGTFVSEKAALEAGVAIDYDTEVPAAFAFAAITYPGILRLLDLDGIRLRNVPVYVGDSAILDGLGLDILIGGDMLRHLRLTVDHHRRELIVAQAEGKLGPTAGQRQPWDIELAAYSGVPVAWDARFRERAIRVTFGLAGFVDGTCVTSAWAARNIDGHSPPTGLARALADVLPGKEHSIEGLLLGGGAFPKWPVEILPPGVSPETRFFDIFVGLDFLSRYRVTVDLNARVCRLEWPLEQ